jgi:hypothetical protein
MARVATNKKTLRRLEGKLNRESDQRDTNKFFEDFNKNFDKPTQLCSLYEKTEGQESFADILKNASDSSTQQDLEDAKNLFDKYTKGIANEYHLISEKNAIEIVTNSIILARFKFEALNILNENKNLTKEHRELAIKTFFGPDTEYDKLDKKYYGSNRYLEKAQAIINGDGKKLKGLLNISMLDINAQNFEIKDEDLDNIFLLFKTIKGELLSKDGSSTLNESSTLKIYTKVFDEKHIERTVIGLALSDPKQIGLLFALLGDKDNNGEIKIQEESLGVMQYTTIPITRLLMVAALLVLSLVAMDSYKIAQLLVNSLPSTIPVILQPFTLYASTAIIPILAMGIGYFILKKISATLEKEAKYTKNLQGFGVATNVNSSGISRANIGHYISGPSMKNKDAIISQRLSNKIEKSCYTMSEIYRENNQKINESIKIDKNIQAVLEGGKHNEFLSKLRIIKPSKKNFTSRIKNKRDTIDTKRDYKCY